MPNARIAITHATVMTAANGTIADGTVVIDGGVIESITAGGRPPADAEIVDATDRFVTPGLVDCHSHIAIELAPGVPRWSSVNEVGTTVSSMTAVEDAFNGSDVDIYRCLAGGLTTANVMHGSANPIGGKSLVMKLRWGKVRVDEFAFEGAPPSLKIAVGENPKIGGGGAGPRPISGPLRYPATRMGIEHVIRDAFVRARAYRSEWQDYQARLLAGRDARLPRRDLQLEPLVEVLEGKRLVHAHCYRADDILMLVRIAEEFGFTITTLHHALESYKVADEVVRHGAGVSTFSDWWGHKIEAVDGIPYNAAMMMRRGVPVSVHSDSAEHARRLNTEAAKAVKWGGLSDDEALALVTINPAIQLGIGQRVGSLEAGKDADVVIWNRHPLSSYAIVDRVYVDGRQYYDRAADSRPLAGTAPPPAVPAARRKTTQADGRAVAVLPPLLRASLPTGALALVNARVFPIARPSLERASVVIRNGVIEAVGTDVRLTPGATVVDVDGGRVYPGFIDARSTLGLTEPGAAGFSDANEMLEFNPQLRAQVAYHNESDAIPIARSNGVTAAAITPGGGIIGGQIAVMNLDGRTSERSTLHGYAGISLQFPETDREAIVDRLARLLEAARGYCPDGASGRDLVLESLRPIVERQRPIFVKTSTEDGVADAIRFSDRVGVRIVISGGLEAARLAPALRARNIPVILGPVLTKPLREEVAHQASYAAAAALAGEGVRLAFATGHSLNTRQLPYHAAQSVAWGLSHDAALRALTLDAAEILGVGDLVGSLEPGKLANLIITNGDPLEVRTTVLRVIISGRDVGVDNRQLALYQRYQAAV